MIKELLEAISKALVDYPDEVEIGEIDGIKTRVYELKVNKSDLGKIIGKGGRTAVAIRTILNGVSTKLKVRAVLEIIEDD